MVMSGVDCTPAAAKAQGISPGTHEAILMWPRNDGDPRCRCHLLYRQHWPQRADHHAGDEIKRCAAQANSLQPIHGLFSVHGSANGIENLIRIDCLTESPTPQRR
jgi:hypothetical protein